MQTSSRYIQRQSCNCGTYCQSRRRQEKSLTIDVDEEGEDEKKVEDMKKRRSTIVQCELLMRDFSASSIASTEKVRMRRKSLIKNGMITED